ncbi:Replication protein A 70 kDa DNA-binding subunit [Dorcoceras hygrometricum]|uniref:Replication protein A 70 kDa DNA-binding subunit n=1 Tax=Dorcoceras hygrometricum TaxID=472368 RepID=A0A2Z7A6M5_9LAMI|nr:Replication protein A 70 kDa DNA-binding subunit [Dorcoceras hygrometricum]
MQWALKLRLVRCYELPAYGKSGDFTLECVLHDKEGDRIHASTKKPILKEGHLFAIKNTIVAENRMNYKTTASKLVRCYELPAYRKSGDFTLECVLHDKEGDRIHASIKKPVLDSGDHIHASIKKPVLDSVRPILKEGHLFAIKNIIVAENRMKYKTTASKYKINFITKTHVCEIFDDSFPSMMFDFKSFTNVKNAEIEETMLFDVIGQVVARDSPQSKEFGGRETRLLYIVLHDYEDNKLSCTPWGDFVNDIMTHLEKSRNNQAIIILQMCRSKQFRGGIRVSNTFYVTNMIVKESFGEIVQFRERCDHFDTTGHLRFKIQVRVVDNTGNALFLLWDREYFELIGKTALELRTEMKNMVISSPKNEYMTDLFHNQGNYKSSIDLYKFL